MSQTEPFNSKPKKRRWPMMVALGALVAAAVIVGVTQFGRKAQTANLPDNCTGRAFAEIGGPFELVNQDGETVSDKTFLGKPALVYFGFTYCPDVCPMSLQSVALALDRAKALGGKDIDNIQPILISIDPERDTPASLKSYVASAGFPTGLIGLTGSVAQVSAAAKAFKVGFRKSIPEGNAAKDYVMDHTSIVYLLDSKGKLRTFFSGELDPEPMAKCLVSLSNKGL